MTHNDTPHSVGPVWTSDQLVAEISTSTNKHSRYTNVHAPAGIRTQNLIRRAAEDLRLRSRGYRDRPSSSITAIIYLSLRFLTAFAVFRKQNAIPLCFSTDLVLHFLLSWLLVLFPFTFSLNVLFSFSPVVSNP